MDVPRAVYRVCICPVLERLFAVEEYELKGRVQRLVLVLVRVGVECALGVSEAFRARIKERIEGLGKV